MPTPRLVCDDRGRPRSERDQQRGDRRARTASRLARPCRAVIAPSALDERPAAPPAPTGAGAAGAPCGSPTPPTQRARLMLPIGRCSGSEYFVTSMNHRLARRRRAACDFGSQRQPPDDVERRLRPRSTRRWRSRPRTRASCVCPSMRHASTSSSCSAKSNALICRVLVDVAQQLVAQHVRRPCRPAAPALSGRAGSPSTSSPRPGRAGTARCSSSASAGTGWIVAALLPACRARRSGRSPVRSLNDSENSACSVPEDPFGAPRRA